MLIEVCAQRIQHRDELPTRNMFRVESDQYINIAGAVEIIAQHRSEQSQPADVVLLAKTANLRFRHVNLIQYGLYLSVVL